MAVFFSQSCQDQEQQTRWLETTGAWGEYTHRHFLRPHQPRRVVGKPENNKGFPGSASGSLPVNARDTRDLGSIPGSGRSLGGGRTWQSTPIFLPGEFQGQRSLAGYSPRGHRESDTTEQLTHTHNRKKPLIPGNGLETFSPAFSSAQGLLDGFATFYPFSRFNRKSSVSFKPFSPCVSIYTHGNLYRQKENLMKRG